MISWIWRASKSMKNLKKLSPEIFGTPKNGRDGQDWLDWLHKCPMWAQWGPNGGPNSIRIANEELGPAKSGSSRGHLRAFIIILLY